jgi:hypothetical protein
MWIILYSLKRRKNLKLQEEAVVAYLENSRLK